MNEVLADLYADTGDARWLALSDRFDHQAIIDPLARREDILAGKHGNTQVPKLLGSLARYIYTGNERDGAAADVLLGRSGPAPQLRHRRARHGTSTSAQPGQAERHGRRAHGRDLQRLQHDQDGARRSSRSSPMSATPTSTSGRCSTTFSARSTRPTAPPATWCRSAGACRASTRTCAELHLLRRLGHGKPRPAWRRHLLRVAGDRLWVNLYVPSTADWKSAGVQPRHGHRLP